MSECVCKWEWVNKESIDHEMHGQFLLMDSDVDDDDDDDFIKIVYPELYHGEDSQYL